MRWSLTSLPDCNASHSINNSEAPLSLVLTSRNMLADFNQQLTRHQILKCGILYQASCHPFLKLWIELAPIMSFSRQPIALMFLGNCDRSRFLRWSRKRAAFGIALRAFGILIHRLIALSDIRTI